MLRRRVFHGQRAFPGSGDDGKEHPGRGNTDGFPFAIQPRSQPLGVFGAGAIAAGRIVRDDVAGLAEPRLIERDRATLGGGRDDLVRHRRIPVPGSNDLLIKTQASGKWRVKNKTGRRDPHRSPARQL